ncbi:uncharacterized protein Dwil_GK27124 [Drosophila willistoni]|nr:uncharacterized protein Dwil_GK27124 [Drosophila willistoni]
MSSKMSCISSNFSSFFLNSLNDASEFSKYLSNGELKCTNFEEFQVFGCGAPQSQPTSQQQQLQYSHTHMTNGVSDGGGGGGGGGGGSSSVPQHFDGSFEFIKYLRHSTDFSSNTSSSSNATESSNHQQTSAASTDKSSSISNSSKLTLANTPPPPPPQSQSPVSSLGLIDLDSSTSQKSRSASRKVAALLSSVSRASSHSLVVMDSSSSALDVFDHDSKQAMFDMQHNITSNGSSNSNESSLELLAFPNSHLNASNSNTSSEGGAGEFVGLLTGCSGGSHRIHPNCLAIL